MFRDCGPCTQDHVKELMALFRVVDSPSAIENRLVECEANVAALSAVAQSVAELLGTTEYTIKSQLWYEPTKLRRRHKRGVRTSSIVVVPGLASRPSSPIRLRPVA